MNQYDILNLVSTLTFSKEQVEEIKKDFKYAENKLEIQAKNRRVDEKLLSKSYTL